MSSGRLLIHVGLGEGRGDRDVRHFILGRTRGFKPHFA